MMGIPMVFINKKDESPEFIKKDKPTKKSNFTEQLKVTNKQLKACNLEVGFKNDEVKSLLGSYNKNKDSKIESTLDELTSLQTKRDESSKKFLVAANVVFAQLKNQKDAPSVKSEDKNACGLCGSTTKKLTKTECCKNYICDDQHLYVPFTYAKTSCYRNHSRYTLCSSHVDSKHPGKWQNCKKCKNQFSTEMYTYYGTNRYNFEKLANAPKLNIECANCSMKSGRVEDFAGSIANPCGHELWYCHKEDCKQSLRAYSPLA